MPYLGQSTKKLGTLNPKFQKGKTCRAWARAAARYVIACTRVGLAKPIKMALSPVIMTIRTILSTITIVTIITIITIIFTLTLNPDEALFMFTSKRTWVQRTGELSKQACGDNNNNNRGNGTDN